MARLPSWVAGAALPFALGACAGEGGEDPRSSVPTPLCISEILYHPVLEDSYEELHEFVEIHNPTDAAVSLAGYTLGGGTEAAFPAVELPPGGTVVVARDREALLGVTEYALEPSLVFGDASRSLDNGGDLVLLRPPRGAAEAVAYNDGPPWPVAADALGASEAWLPADWLPLESHRHRGVSLERVSCALSADDPASWIPSPIDGPTPGRTSAGAAAAAPPIVLTMAIGPRPLTAATPITVTATLSTAEGLGAVTLEYFVDAVAVADEPTETVAMTPNGGGTFSATLPAQAAGAVVRYRFLLDGAPLSPRPSDPYRWHAAFVDPGLETTSRTYHLFLSPDDWTALWDNVEGGRTAGCDLSPTWDAEVPGVFAHEGRVYDVRLRYQGSMFNRTSGNELRGYAGDGPARPDPPLALSFLVKFPRYARFEGARKLVLNKLTQGCPGFTSAVGYELFRRAGLPGPATRFVRVQVNGAYYHYAQELGAIDEALIEAWQEGTGEPVGHLFKAAGSIAEEGLLDAADGRLLPEACGHTSAERYAAVYERKTWDWAGHDELIALIEGLHAARAQGEASLRDYLAAHFDVDRALTYLAIINWLGAWDDTFQNYYLYQRRSDGRWCFFPWDLDLTAGGHTEPDASLFLGEEGDPDNRDGYFSYFKDAFLRAYRAEYVARLRELNGSLLTPATIEPLLAATLAALDRDEAERAPAGLDCDVDAKLAEYREYAAERSAFVARATE